MPLRSYTHAEIVLTERARLEKPLLLMIWVGTAAFALADANAFYLVAATLAVAANYLAVRQNKELYVRRLFVNLGVLLVTIMAFVEFYTTDRSLLVIIGHSMLLIQLCMLFQQKQSRQYAELLALNMLLMVTAGLICFQPWFAFAAIGYLVLVCYVAMIFTLKRGLDLAATVTLPAEPAPLDPSRVAWNVARAWPATSLRRLALAILLPSMLVGIGAFLLAPRAAEELFTAVLSAGFDPVVRPGDRKVIYESNRVAGRVKVYRDASRTPIQAPTEASRYLRGAVLDWYANSAWRHGNSEGRVSLTASFDPEDEPNVIREEITYTPTGEGALPTPYPTLGLDRQPGLQVRVTPDLELVLEGGYPPGSTIRYTTQSLPGAPPQTIARMTSRERVEVPSYLTLNERTSLPPDARQRILELATTWCRDLLALRGPGTPPGSRLDLQIAQRLADRLRTEYAYTLDLSDSDPSRDAVDDFLFQMKKGHCEYFASALAVLCRVLNVEARVATGFLMTEYDASNQEYILRDRDAHAWCEVYTNATGWVIEDATPASDATGQRDQGWWQRLQQAIEDLRFFWYENIVGYDATLQRDVTNETAEWSFNSITRAWNYLRRLVHAIREFLSRGILEDALISALRFLLTVAACATGLLLLRWVWRRWRRRRRDEQPPDPGAWRQLKALRTLTRALARRGLIRQPGQTLREFAREAAARLALPAGPLEQLTTLAYEWRFGLREPSASQLDQAEKDLQTLLDALRHRKPARAT